MECDGVNGYPESKLERQQGPGMVGVTGRTEAFGRHYFLLQTSASGRKLRCGSQNILKHEPSALWRECLLALQAAGKADISCRNKNLLVSSLVPIMAVSRRLFLRVWLEWLIRSYIPGAFDGGKCAANRVHREILSFNPAISKLDCFSCHVCTTLKSSLYRGYCNIFKRNT